jgi:PAS domain S-box-containing protein
MTSARADGPGARAEQESLEDGRALCAAMIGVLAQRWRARLREGRLAPDAASDASRLVERLEAAEAVLQGDPAPGAGGAPGGSSPERTLGDGEDSFRLLVQGLEDYAIVMVDPGGRIASWNAGAERITGYRADEAQGRRFEIFYTPEDLAVGKPTRALAAARDEGRHEEEGWRVRKDGSRFWAHVVWTAVLDDQGMVRGFAKITRDISEQRRTQIALRQGDERFHLLVNSVKDYAIFLLDLNGYIVSWNAGAERTKGYRADEIIGRHFSVFYTEDAVSSGHPAYELARAIAEGRYEEEGWRVRKDGSRFWANVVINAIRPDDGETVGFVKITRDVTERREMQLALNRANAELERRVGERTAELQLANAELESFSYSVSHDLRAPLRSIDGFGKLLLSQAAPKLDLEERDYLDRIRAAAQRMSHLIDDLLNLSRVARAEIERRPVDLAPIAESVLAELGRAEPERAVSVSVEPGLTADGDRRFVQIALENLLSNAWKFTRNTPAPRIEVGRSERDGRAVFFVRDNGTGFDMTYAAKLFTPFKRLHGKEFEGTGIGLATVQRIVRKHGGAIWAESEPGRGATFFFTLGGP